MLDYLAYPIWVVSCEKASFYLSGIGFLNYAQTARWSDTVAKITEMKARLWNLGHESRSGLILRGTFCNIQVDLNSYTICTRPSSKVGSPVEGLLTLRVLFSRIVGGIAWHL